MLQRQCLIALNLNLSTHYLQAAGMCAYRPLQTPQTIQLLVFYGIIFRHSSLLIINSCYALMECGLCDCCTMWSVAATKRLAIY